MRHAINFVRPLTQTAIAREEYGNLCFFCTTTKPRTSCFLLEYATENSFLKSGELLQDVIDGEVQPINFELANECGEVLFRIAPRWKCNSLLLTASLLWEINLAVSEALAGSSNHNLPSPPISLPSDVVLISTMKKVSSVIIPKVFRASKAPLPCENHARKMRTFFTLSP